MADVTRVPHRMGLVIWRWEGASEPDVATKLRRTYRIWFGKDSTVTTRGLPLVRTGIAVIGDGQTPRYLENLVVWGDPVGTNGPATDEEIKAVAERPEAARDLLGRFVIVSLSPELVQVITGPDVVNPLRHASSGDVESWSTRGIAATVAVDVPVGITPERIPEFISTGYTFDEHELIGAASSLSEATCIRLTSRRVKRSVYWPVVERFHSARAVSATQLRTRTVQALEQLTVGTDVAIELRLDPAHLLLASALAQLGVTQSSFTVGKPDSPEVLAGAAVARRLGWEHRQVAPHGPGRPSIERLMRTARWTEGMHDVWDSYAPPPSLGFTRGSTLLTAAGGDLGFAPLWAGFDDEQREQPLNSLISHMQSGLPPAAADLLAANARSAAARYESFGWNGLRVVDAFQVRGQVRKSLGRNPEPQSVGGVRTVFTGGILASSLLAIPAAKRESGSTMIAAIGSELADLLDLPQPAPKPSALDSARLRLRLSESASLARQVRRALSQSPSPVTEVMGRSWLTEVARQADTDPVAHRRLWRALAVDAFGAAIPGIERDLRVTA